MRQNKIVHDDASRRINLSSGDTSISDTDTTVTPEQVDLASSCSSSSSDESDRDVAGTADDRINDEERSRLSVYEIERLHRITENKRKFEEIFGKSSKSGKKAKKVIYHLTIWILL